MSLTDELTQLYGRKDELKKALFHARNVKKDRELELKLNKIAEHRASLRTRQAVLDYIMQNIVWHDVPLKQFLLSKTFYHPVFAKFNIDVRAPSLRRMLQHGYAMYLFIQSESIKCFKAHLMVHYHRCKTTSYVGLTVRLDPDHVPTTEDFPPPMTIGIIDFEDGSPEARVWPSKIAEKLREWDLEHGDHFLSVTVFSNSNQKKDKQIVRKLKASMEEVLGSKPPASHPGDVRSHIDISIKDGVKYLTDARQNLIKATLDDKDDCVPECTKEILFYRTNCIHEFWVMEHFAPHKAENDEEFEKMLVRLNIT